MVDNYTLDTITEYSTAPNTILPKNNKPLTPAEMKGYVASIKTTSLAPLFGGEVEQMKSLQDEYKYYMMRYKYALDKYFQAADATIKAKWLEKANILNVRLHNFVGILDEINKEVKISMDAVSSDQLKKQADVLAKIEADKDVYKKMIDYTKEKANSSNNLLNLYAFLNIVALGVLFYVYRST